MPQNSPTHIVNVAKDSEVQYSVTDSYRLKNASSVYYVYAAGKTVCKSDYYCHFFPSNHYCFMHFIKGKGTLRHDGKDYTPTEGDLFILQKGKEWEYATDPNDPWELVWFNVNNSFLAPLLEFYALNETVRVSAQSVRPTLEKIFSILERKEGSVYERRDSVTRELFTLVRDLGRIVSLPKSNSKQEEDARKIKEYLDDHITEDIRVSEVCRIVFRSEGDATTIFRQMYGSSIKKYVLEAKLRIASQHLTESQLSVSQIASMLSFCDAQHFSRIFRDRYNTSPLQYRKASRRLKSEE